jgi:ribonuclease HI
MSEDPLIIYCDGFCDPNPGGIATYGWIAKQGDREIHSHCGFSCSGPDANNAVAEYVAVISALEWLLGSKHSDREGIIKSDSQQIIGQIKGSYEVRPEDLIPFHKAAKRLIKHFRRLKFEWIPREQNKEADDLAYQAFVGTLRAQRFSMKLKAQKIAPGVVARPDGSYDVPSQHKPDIIYNVDITKNTCTCPDPNAKGSKSGYCKHIWAVKISLGVDIDDIA